MTDWPFDDPRNTAAITLRQIMREKQPILHATHDADDGQWQFLGWDTPETKDAMLIALEEVWKRDPTIGELADLPLGWRAWRRSIDQPWTREPVPVDDDDG